MTPRASISVIVPVHNPGGLLRQTLESVYAQTAPPAEVVVVDDGSSEDITWVESLPTTRLVQTAFNGGPGLARNLGVAISTGEWLAFLDQDDIWEPTKLAQQLYVMTEGIDLCHTNFDLIDIDGRRTHPGYGEPASYPGMLRGRLGLLLSSTVVRRSTFEEVGGFNHLLRVQQDLDFFLRVATHYHLAYVPSVQVHYRLHEGQTSKNYWRAAQEIRAVYQINAIACDNDPDLTAAVQRGTKYMSEVYSSQALDAARLAYRSRGLGAAWTPFVHMLRLRPRSLMFVVRSELAKAWRRARHVANSVMIFGVPAPQTIGNELTEATIANCIGRKRRSRITRRAFSRNGLREVKLIGSTCVTAKPFAWKRATAVLFV